MPSGDGEEFEDVDGDTFCVSAGQVTPGVIGLTYERVGEDDLDGRTVARTSRPRASREATIAVAR